MKSNTRTTNSRSLAFTAIHKQCFIQNQKDNSDGYKLVLAYRKFFFFFSDTTQKENLNYKRMNIILYHIYHIISYDCITADFFFLIIFSGLCWDNYTVYRFSAVKHFWNIVERVIVSLYWLFKISQSTQLMWTIFWNILFLISFGLPLSVIYIACPSPVWT